MAASNDHNPWEGNGHTAMPVAGLPTGNNQAKRSVSDINLLRLLKVWPWMLVSTAVAVFGAWLYLRYTVSVYEASISVSLKEEKNIAEVSSLFDTRNPTIEKTDLLRSPAVSKWVVDTLGLQYTAIQKGKIKDKDLYGKLAWRIVNYDYYGRSFSFTIHPGKSDSSFNWTNGSQQGVAKLGESFAINDNWVVVTGSMKFTEDAEIICSYRDPWDVAFSVSGGLSVKTNPSSSSVTLYYSDILPQRAIHILESVVDAYNFTTAEHKNKSLVQSINFISERLVPLGNELDSIETRLARYKSSKGFVGQTANGQLYLEKIETLDEKENELTLQKELINKVDRYINNPATPEQNLSIIGLSDGYLQGLISEFMALRAQRDKLAMVATPEHPSRKIVDNQLQQVKENISVQLRNLRSNVNLKENQLSLQIADAQSLLRGTPNDEKELLEQQRQQNIKLSLFLMMLQRREEASIALAATTVDIRILAPARSRGPVSPKSGQLYTMALALGLFLPVGLALLKEVLNTKVTSKKQLEQMLSVPFLGSVDQVEKAEDQLAIVSNHDRSAAAEQIRAIRANLRYYAPKKGPLYVLITSSLSGEGKTFLSGNLAKSFALQGIRVALVEFDMRRPRLAKKMDYSPKRGLPSVLLGECSPEDILFEDPETPNLHLYPTGPMPPNPSELMLRPEMDGLKKYFDHNYDVVILDTPPRGLVADAQLLSAWAHISLVVVRFNFTPRKEVQEIDKWGEQGKMGNLGIIFNGIRTSGYYGYNYYGYGRKYGYSNYYQ